MKAVTYPIQMRTTEVHSSTEQSLQTKLTHSTMVLCPFDLII